MTDSELGRIWAKHFPKHRNGHVSELICRMICQILEKKILLERTAENDQAIVQRVLLRCGIPVHQFAACRDLKALASI